MVFVSLDKTNTIMKTQQGKGLLTALGIGAGLYAWWKYRNMSPAKKEELQSKVNDVGRKIKTSINDIESQVSTKYGQLKNAAQHETNDIMP